MHRGGLVSLDEQRVVAVAAEEIGQLLAANAGKDRRVGDLEAVEVQDRQHRAVAGGIEKLVRMPACRERAGFRFPVADDAGDDQVRIVERGAIGMRQRIAELATFVNRAGRLRRDVAGNAVGPGELAKQPLQPVPVALDVRVDLRIGAFEIGIRDQPRPAVAGADDVDHIQIVLLDQPVQMHIEEVQTRRGAPMAEQARLDVAALEGNLEQRIVLKIDLPDRQVIGGAPIGIHLFEQIGRKRVRHGGLRARRP